MFRDRTDAAQQLADALERYRGTEPLVLAIPRGAVEMGAVVADELGGDLDVVLVKKIGAPGNSELAIGAVSESREVFLGPEARELNVPEDYVRQETERLGELLDERRRRYTGDRPPADPSGRTVILVDDGIATGSTMYAAIRSVRTRDPERVVVATGIGSARSIRELEEVADEIVCLEQPGVLFGISQGYAAFPQVSDRRVAELLRERHNQPPSPS